MDTLFLKVSTYKRETVILPCKKIEVNETTVLVKLLVQNQRKTLFLEVKHNQINTLLDLTGVYPYELWYFDHKKEFTGKSFSLQKGSTPFQIQTQSSFIALVQSNTKDVNQKVVNASTLYRDFIISKYL